VWFGEEHHVQAISPTTAYLMSSMLSDVVSSGTATRVRAAGFTLPAGGKTGTTDDYADAWFIGYTPHLLAGVWFGLDQPAPIMREGFGGTVAVPAWARFMTAATKGAKPDWYRMPEDVEKVRMCRLSGMRAGPRCDEELLDVPLLPGEPVLTTADAPLEPNVYEDLFPIGSLPSEICTLHDPFPRPGG
jgi:penicillin-binding protein 1A